MRSKQDVQIWLDTHTVVDCEYIMTNKYLQSQIDPDFSFTFYDDKQEATFEQLRDFIHSEPEVEEKINVKTDNEYLAHILNEIRGIHEILKADVRDKSIIDKMDKDDLQLKLNQHENTNFS